MKRSGLILLGLLVAGSEVYAGEGLPTTVVAESATTATTPPAQGDDTLPASVVKLVEEIDYVDTEPLARWPHGLYYTMKACKKARETFIGSEHVHVNYGPPYAVWSCDGRGQAFDQLTNVVPEAGSPTTAPDGRTALDPQTGD